MVLSRSHDLANFLSDGNRAVQVQGRALQFPQNPDPPGPQLSGVILFPSVTSDPFPGSGLGTGRELQAAEVTAQGREGPVGDTELGESWGLAMSTREWGAGTR